MNSIEALLTWLGTNKCYLQWRTIPEQLNPCSLDWLFWYSAPFLFPHYGDGIDITSQIAGYLMYSALSPGAQRDLLSCHVFCDKDLRVPLENPFHDK